MLVYIITHHHDETHLCFFRKCELRANTDRSEMDIKRTLEERSDSVITCLCEDPDDLQLLADKIKSFSREFVLFCPIEPFNHDSSIINNFFEKVENDGRGESKVFCLLESEVGKLMINLQEFSSHFANCLGTWSLTM